MGDSVDLTGDGGVMKTIVKRAKPDAGGPTENLPLVDGCETSKAREMIYSASAGYTARQGRCSSSRRPFTMKALLLKRVRFSTQHMKIIQFFSFEIGSGSVIKAWDIALRTMKVGEVAKITCKPEYAYGSAGSPPEIPPDSTLVFEVELLACRPRKGSNISSVSEERARLDELKKQREIAAATKEEEKKKREEAKAAAAARVQAKLDAKKGPGKGKGKGK